MNPTNHANQDSDWLISEFASNQSKECVLHSIASVLYMARLLCSIDIDEFQALVETVWYALEDHQEE